MANSMRPEELDGLILTVLKDHFRRNRPENIEERLLVRTAEALNRQRKPKNRVLWAMAASLLFVVTAALFVFYSETKGWGRVTADAWTFIEHDAGNSRFLKSGCIPNRVLWEKEIPSWASTYKPLVDNNRLIISGRYRPDSLNEPRLSAYNCSTGELQWSRPFRGGPGFETKRFPDRCIESGLLYISDGERCHVINPVDGRETALFDPPSGIQGWAFLSATEDYLVGSDRTGNRLFCLNRADGRMRWSFQTEGASYVPALSDGKLLIHTDNGQAFALSLRDGRSLWQVAENAGDGRSRVYSMGTKVLVSSENDYVMLFSVSDGRLLWKNYVRGSFWSGTAMDAQAVYLAGGMRVLDIESGRTLWDKDNAINGNCASPTLLPGFVLSTAYESRRGC